MDQKEVGTVRSEAKPQRVRDYVTEAVNGESSRG
jgi:hypothetical protein